MGGTVRWGSESANIPSEVENGIMKAGILEVTGYDVGEISLADGSEIEFHPLGENDFPTGYRYVFKVRADRHVGDFRNEHAGFEIPGIPKQRDVVQRIEKSLRSCVAFLRYPHEFQKSIRNFQPSQTVDHGKRRIGNESGEFRLEIRDVFAYGLDERVKAPVVFPENRDDEQGPKGAERIIEFALQRTILRS